MSVNKKKYLDDQEAIALAKLVQIENSSEALERLCENYKDYIYGIVGQNLKPGMQKDDLLQEGRLGVIEAANTFDESRNVKFLTYSMSKVRTKIINAVRNRHTVTLPRRDGYSNRKFEAPGENLSFLEKEELDGTDEDSEMPFDVLTQDEAKVIKLIFYENMKTMEVATIMGIHWKRVYKLQLNAIMKMRGKMLGLTPEPQQHDENIEVHNERWAEILFDIFDQIFSKSDLRKIKYSITPEERKIIEAFHVRGNIAALGEIKTIRKQKDLIIKKMQAKIDELANRKTKV